MTNILKNRMKRNREKGVSEGRSWYKLPVIEYKPLEGEKYKDYIERIFSERPNAPNPIDGYYNWENHHIIPICCGGEDVESNKIWLLLSEHYWAHMLLCKEHPLHLGLLNSARLLASRIGTGIVTSEDIKFINEEIDKIYHVTLAPDFTKNSEPL